MKVRFILLILCLSLFVAAAPQKRPNVVLITIDTLRADRLGSYGYKQAKTPVLDQLAAEGTRFTNAVSHVPLTRPSHASIFSGLYPYEHGIHDNIAPPLNKDIPVLAEILKKNGYQTAAFVASFVINSQSGLQRGFDTYEDRFDPKKQPTKFALSLEKRGEDVEAEFSSWLKQHSGKPYFAWIHLYDPHFPYEPPAPYNSTFAERPYDGEVAYTDEIIGRILKLINQETLLIVTSDHGESLGDHGENAHSYFIYDATLHVPLIIRWNGNIKGGQTVEAQARLVDLYPTTLDLLSIPLPKRINGTSLKPWLLTPSKPDADLPSYCETFTPWIHFGWSRLQGVRQSGWKYIEAPKAELYQVSTDPKELANVASQNRAKAAQMQLWLKRSGALNVKAQSTTQDLDPETLEKMASLGYAGIAPPPAPDAVLADPKDKLEDFKLFNVLIREGIEDFQNERYKEAAAKFQKLRSREIPSFEVHYYLGRSLLRLKSYDKARTELEAAAGKLPHFLPVYRDLSELFEAVGDSNKAENALLQGLAVSPDHPSLVQPLAWLYQRQNRVQDAERVLKAELAKYPDDIEARYRLGAIYRDSNRPDLAIEEFAEILRRAPNEAEAHNQIGMIHGAHNRLKQANESFTKAAVLDPDNENIRKNIEVVQQRMKMEPSSTTIRFRIIQTKTLAAAQTLLRKLNAGEEWTQLARDYSIHPSARTGNSVIETSAKDLDPALQETLNSLAPGQTSPVIQTSSGFFILRLEED